MNISNSFQRLKNQPIACINAIECVIIMADKHISETHYLFLTEKDKHHAQWKRLYFNRASGGNCHHCAADGDIDAGPKSG